MTATTAPTKGKSQPKDEAYMEESNNNFPSVALWDIKIAERPVDGQDGDQLFFNPRSLESFTDEEMASLMASIAEDGLLQPPVVRAWTDDGTISGNIVRLQLIAGERRLRTLQRMYDEDVPCNNADGTPTTAKVRYARIPVKMYYNIDDAKALRIAFAENQEHQKLTIKDEIALVERLVSRGLNQSEIVTILGTNVTWVSQTANFRKELPQDAFERLMAGKLSRHVAVKMLSYKSEDREKLYTETVRVQKEEYEATQKKLEDEKIRAEDEEDLAAEAEQEAINKRNAAEAKKAERKRKQAEKKQQEIKEKEARLQEEKDTIRQGHLQKAGQQANIAPKKATALTKQMIQQFYVELVGKWLQNGKIDLITKKEYPAELLETVVHVAKSILTGGHDPGQMMRTLLVNRGVWELPEGYEEKPVELLEVEGEGDELE